MLALYQDHPRAEEVEVALSSGEAVISAVNLGEVLYKLERDHGPEQANTLVDRLRAVATVEEPDWGLVIRAAHVKARGRISYADAFCVATAQRHDAPLYTGDPEILARDDVAGLVDLRTESEKGAIVAIDGPSGAGKSTVARALARELGFTYLDTGAMYRCVGLLSLRSPGAIPRELAGGASIDLRGGAGEPLTVVLFGEDVTAAIRAPDVSEAASRVAADPGVRAAVVARQRRLLASGQWVAEGRDIGTVVAPDAVVKVFLTADPRERARRRAAELGADAEGVRADQALRDERDSTRAVSPLRPAHDAIVLDTSEMDVGEVVVRIAQIAGERLQAH